jgi:hypothetical protein
MSDCDTTDPNAPEPSRTRSDRFGDWLTVSEAVVHCSLAGLSRTPRTIRKWAQRSFGDPDNGELVVRREDVTHGFCRVVERASLDRKIEQELQFEARSNGERKHTGLEMTAPVRPSEMANSGDIGDENTPEPERTSVPEARSITLAVRSEGDKVAGDPDGLRVGVFNHVQRSHCHQAPAFLLFRPLGRDCQ